VKEPKCRNASEKCHPRTPPAIAEIDILHSEFQNFLQFNSSVTSLLNATAVNRGHRDLVQLIAEPDRVHEIATESRPALDRARTLDDNVDGKKCQRPSPLFGPAFCENARSDRRGCRFSTGNCHNRNK
jgi:hypothetical protein